MKTYPIFLIGFMASGKTSLGKKLANQLQLPFIDLDQMIEREEGMSINQLFKERGEEYFRKREREALYRMKSGEKAVVALGGGTACSTENMTFIQENGYSIYFFLEKEIIIGRLRQSREKRPMVAALDDEKLKEFVEKKLSERELYYEQANLKVAVTELKVNELANTIRIELG